ncbi:MAG TPA: TolC family protein [Prolixibacteraceae bacterium]|nr:TolC family protein [Prolixibacteraceae bacterium]
MKNEIIVAGMTLLLLFNVLMIDAQRPLTLKECINYSDQNNSKVKIAKYDADASKKRINEQVGAYLPQINGSGSVDDNLKLTSVLIPAQFFGGEAGTFMAMSFGSKYSLAGGVQLTQKLYDMPGILAIRSAKVSGELSDYNLQKTSELSVYNISVAYYQTMIIQMQMNVLKSNLKASEESLKSIELKYANGMAKKIDVDKIRVNCNNTRSQLQQAELNYAQSLNTLKFQMGMPVDSALVLADINLNDGFESFEKVNNEYRIENMVDYKIQKTNYTLSEVEKKRTMASFQPTLSFYSNYNVNAYRKKFNFFEADQDWYPSYGFGVKLTVPIFDGLQRVQRVAQSELNVKKAQENIRYTEQSIKVDISNYETRYQNALANIRKEKENLELAESVYKNTQMEYKQGTSTTLDLIQSESSYMVAQNTYFNKLLDLYIARIDQEKAKGSLTDFINRQK